MYSFCLPHIKKNVKPDKNRKRIWRIVRRNIKRTKKVVKINQKIEKHEIIEGNNIKGIESEILDETKVLEEIETKLEKIEKVKMKKRFWNEIDKQETLERLKIKIEKDKLKKSK